jgi:hypothetical protein
MWFWLNVPPAALIFLAMTLIPLWLVIKRPDTGPQATLMPGPAQAVRDGSAAQAPSTSRLRAA